MDGLLSVHLLTELCSPMPGTTAFIEFPEDHFPGRSVDHANLSTARHRARLGRHGNRQRTIVNHDLVGWSDHLPAKHGPVRAHQGSVALNAKVAGSYTFNLSHFSPLLLFAVKLLHMTCH